MEASWIDICGVEEIWPNTGVCALVGATQIAVFRLAGTDGEHLYAIDNRDPFSGANVLSRGLLGNLGERRVVASPIYKQHFDLATGACIEDPAVSVRTYRVRVADGRVQVAA
ncbi:nitrite reductase small subunit NirD [Fontimonas sp. SYSU GA230001]|uniref:nitrite reductase small subunit NirD n=1 Tax=Fontimonas sp. SYSU GA230001 TaxID=3142450 RepID=UPI0032B5409A